jgi:hypothetical protein
MIIISIHILYFLKQWYSWPTIVRSQICLSS